MESNKNGGQPARIHFIGIGGIGMSALARLFLHEKKIVSGSDRSPSVVTEGLEALGIRIFYTQVPENITDDIDMVVYTAAMPTDHPELVEAQHRGIRTLNYFEALGECMNPYYLIAVAGAHGKTTTTAMLTDVFEDAGKDPTVVIGSLRTKTHSNFRAGKSKYAIVEACEYQRHFLSLAPTILVITNIDAEHLDYYKDIADVQSAFRALAEKVPESGAVIANIKDYTVRPVVAGLACRIIDYTPYVDLLTPLKALGMHNRLNAAAVRAVADAEGLDARVTIASLSEFAGTWRRFEYKGKTKTGAEVYDDYAHHPTEITATLRMVKENFKNTRILVAFHPHLYSRTEMLFEEFVSALSLADEILIAPIFAARDEVTHNTSSATLAEAIRKNGKTALAIETFEEIKTHIEERTDENTIVITMGAGDIYKVADTLTQM